MMATVSIGNKAVDFFYDSLENFKERGELALDLMLEHFPDVVKEGIKIEGTSPPPAPKSDST